MKMFTRSWWQVKWSDLKRGSKNVWNRYFRPTLEPALISAAKRAALKEARKLENGK